jgi:hypothetical protein
MDAIYQTLNSLIRDLVGNGSNVNLHGGGKSDLKGMVEKFSDTFKWRLSQENIKHINPDEIKKNIDQIEINVVWKQYSINLRTWYAELLRKNTLDFSVRNIINDYIKSCEPPEYDYMFDVGLNVYEIQSFIVQPVLEYFKSYHTVDEIVDYINKLFQIVLLEYGLSRVFDKVGFLEMELMLTKTLSLSTILYMTLTEMLNPLSRSMTTTTHITTSNDISLYHEQFEKLIIELIDEHTQNVGFLSPYMFSYYDSDKRNKILEHIESTCDVLTLHTKMRPWSITYWIIFCKNSGDIIKNNEDVGQPFYSHTKKHKYRELIEFIKEKNQKLKYPIAYYDKMLTLTYDKFPCICNVIFDKIYDKQYTSRHIESIIEIYNKYNSDENFVDFVDSICNYRSMVKYDHNNNGLVCNFIMDCFKFENFSEYRNITNFGLYKWFDFDKVNSNGDNVLNQLIESVDLYTELPIDVIHATNNLLNENAQQMNTIDLYLKYICDNDKVKNKQFDVFIHILNRMFQIYTREEIESGFHIIEYDPKFTVIIMYYLTKYNTIHFNDMQQVYLLITECLTRLDDTYKYTHSNDPFFKKYNFEKTIESNFGIKIIERLIHISFEQFSKEDVLNMIRDYNIHKCIVSIDYFGLGTNGLDTDGFGEELISIVRNLIVYMSKQGLDMNYVGEYRVYTSPILNATNNDIIYDLMVNGTKFGEDIFETMFWRGTDFHFYEMLYEDIYHRKFSDVINQYIELGKVKHIEEQLNDYYLGFNQDRIEKYEKYGVLQKYMELGLPITYVPIHPGVASHTPRIHLSETLYDKTVFDEYISHPSFHEKIDRFRNIANERIRKRIRKRKYEDMYTQFCQEIVQYYTVSSKIPVIASDMIISYKNSKFGISVRVLHELVKYLNSTDDEKLIKKYINTHHLDFIDSDKFARTTSVYQKYFDMCSSDHEYILKSVEYLNRTKLRNPEYYYMLDFWIFDKFQQFNEALQQYGKILTRETLEQITNQPHHKLLSKYTEFYRSVILSELIYNAPRPTNTFIAYRGVKTPDAMPENRYPVGKNIVFTRFTSITQDYAVAYKFGMGSASVESDNIIKFIIPKNSVCMALVTDQGELLLPRYSIFRYIGNNTLIYIGYNLRPTNKFTQGLHDKVMFDESYITELEDDYKDILNAHPENTSRMDINEDEYVADEYEHAPHQNIDDTTSEPIVIHINDPSSQRLLTYNDFTQPTEQVRNTTESEPTVLDNSIHPTIDFGEMDYYMDTLDTVSRYH